MQLGAGWYARESDWKLNEKGELFSMKDAPFVEAPVAAGSSGVCDPDTSARVRCSGALLCAPSGYSTDSYHCREPIVACPADWPVRRWSPGAEDAEVALVAGASGARGIAPTCMDHSLRGSLYEDVASFVAPSAGLFHFVLTFPGVSGAVRFALSARRYCGLAVRESELACTTVAPEGREAAIDVPLDAGASVALVINHTGAWEARYRLSATRTPR